ncbi:MAG: beta-galactosidase [Lachnospiraceae bacterium]|nr:beta-galactosidase [Lachnospiraceae bacterium]
MIKIGLDYYPEQWDEDFLPKDVEHMKKSGVKIVRLGEFAWSRIEKKEGEFDFGWLDRAVEEFGKAGIEVMLSVPTNTPPRWLFRKHPEIIKVGRGGGREQIGIRGHRCLNSQVLMEYADKITKQIVERYNASENVIGYQIDNEIEANWCGCETCNKLFREYLQGKYKDIDELNDIYGNQVWSGDFVDFEDVTTPPAYQNAWLNPAYMMDYARFAAKSATDYCEKIAELIRKYSTKEVLVTTNTWFPEHLPDYYKLYKNLDFVGYDNYPTTDVSNMASHAFHLDLMRGIKQDSFWIMEGLSGAPGSWGPMGETPMPGMIKGYALQAIAHGADTVLNFRYRTAKKGAEMFWNGLIGHDNVIGRRYEEFTDLIDCIKTFEHLGISDSKVVSEAAILYNVEDEMAFKLQHQSDGMYYLKSHMAWHRAFTRFGVGVDVVNGREDFMKKGKNYKILVAPCLYIYDEVTEKLLHEFVENGGTLILTPRSGVKDKHNNCLMKELPSWVRDLAGVKVKECDSIGNKQQKVLLLDEMWRKHLSDINISKPTDFDYIVSTQWCDILEVETAETLAVYASKFYDGEPAVTVNSYGNGRVFYVGTYFDDVGYESLLMSVLGKHDLKAIEAYKDGREIKGTNMYTILPEGIEVTKRVAGDRVITFIFNDAPVRQTFKYKGNEYDLQPFEMMVIGKL